MQDMEAETLPLTNSAAIWERVLQFDEELSPAAARVLLKLRFPPRDLKRMRELSAKARAGTLAADEQVEIDTYERLGCLLDILHSRARLALRKAKGSS
jgi:hypothetical protein